MLRPPWGLVTFNKIKPLLSWPGWLGVLQLSTVTQVPLSGTLPSVAGNWIHWVSSSTGEMLSTKKNRKKIEWTIEFWTIWMKYLPDAASAAFPRFKCPIERRIWTGHDGRTTIGDNFSGHEFLGSVLLYCKIVPPSRRPYELPLQKMKEGQYSS